MDVLKINDDDDDDGIPHSHLRKTETFDVYGFGIFLWEVVTQKRPLRLVEFLLN